MSRGSERKVTLRTGVLSAALGATLVFAACREHVAAPGACPNFCPNRGFTVVDTVVQGSLEQDEWAKGYTQPHEASAMQVVRDTSSRDSWGLIRFAEFAGSPAAGALRDSFVLSVQILNVVENVEDLELLVYRVPAGFDASTTFADMVPYFHDSTQIGTIPISDTLVRVSTVLPSEAFPAFVDDTLVAAVGLALSTDSGGFIDLSTKEGANPLTTLTLHYSVEEDGDTVARSQSKGPIFDTYVAPEPPPPGPDALGVGGTPSSRAILRVDIPPAIADSSDIVRATLILVPEGPVLGGPGDSLLFQAFGLRADIGVKSPLLFPSTSDGELPGSVRIPVGSADTIRVDITHIVRPWQSDSTLPQSLLLAVLPEGATLGEVRVLSSESNAAPSLHLTYVPLFLTEEL